MQAYRVSLVREGEPGAPITTPTDAVRQLVPMFEGLDREHFAVVALDARNQTIGFHTVSIGTLSASLVHPREVFKFAILCNACFIILAHNHPSGDPTPSVEDTQITRQLVDSGRILGIDVIDHIIIAGTGFISFKERGLL